MVFFLSGCDSFKVAGQFQSGRQAFLAKNYEEALTSFQQVARADPNYIFESGLYRQGIWNYVGRAQYNTGKLLEARKSLERALSVYQDDHLAKLYLGLTRARSDDSANGARDIESGMKGLYDWLEHYESTKPFEAFWDPGREIRSAGRKAGGSAKAAFWPTFALHCVKFSLVAQIFQAVDYHRSPFDERHLLPSLKFPHLFPPPRGGGGG
jgi:tetratricopeptide (TPR) repeat protein